MENIKFSNKAIAIYSEESRIISHELENPENPSYINLMTASFFRRLSALFEEQKNIKNIPVACKEGCSFCCRDNKVEVFFPEVLAIAGNLIQTCSEISLEKIKNRLRQTVQKTGNSSSGKIHRVYRQCALLEDHRCSIYEIRPANCRQFHSLNVKWCENKYINPAANIPDMADPDLKQKLHAAIAGLEDAFTRAGFEMIRYELNQALFALLDDPVIGENWFKNQKQNH